MLGVARNMGGWENWRQTALQGPPTPAPISFTGLGETGLAALDLLDLHDEGPHMTDDFRTPYPGWDVLAKWDTPSYNDQTRDVLRHRLDPPPRRAL